VRAVMPPLRILHVTPYAPEAWAYGGIPRVTGTLTRELARQGHQVTICATDACSATTRMTGIPRGTARRPASFRTADGVDVRVFRNLSNRLAYHAQMYLPIGLGRFLKEHAREFDVAHLHACRNSPGVLASRALWRAGVPYLLAPNGTAPRLERRLLAKRAFDLVAGHAVSRRAARFLAVSRSEMRQLAGCGIEATRVREIPNPVDIDELDQLDALGLKGGFRDRLGVGDSPLIVFLGKITPRKRVDLLVRAFAALRRPRAHLAIAGNDMGGLSEARAAVRSLDLGGRVTFTGLLTGADRLVALADADVVVYASEHEVFGLVPLEALLAGTPVVVADDSGCGEIITSLGGQHVVPAGDVGALSRAIASVLDSPERSKAAAAEAGIEVRRRYSGRAVAASLSDLYAEIVAEPLPV
jgi:glycosyltransferase involved in cell wall biosynthesis